MADRLRISSSQDETFHRCKRLWWFLYCQKMPTPPKGHFDFGTILHEVCERYLLADDLGRVPPWSVQKNPSIFKGQEQLQPVNLYPQGWDETDGRKLPPVEAGLIRRLITKAIAEGVLERQADRRIEHWFAGEIIEGVDMVGIVDVLLPGEIQDHKSTKSMRWAKTPASLKQSYQMLNYAKLLIDADPDLEEVTLRHNVYCKDPNKLEVRRVETKVSKAEVVANFERLQGVAEDMLVLAGGGLDLDDWQTIEGPSQPNACSAFGGCPMRSICGGKETPDQYRTRVERQITKNPLQKPATWDDKWGRITKATSNKKDPSVDIFEKRLAATKDKVIPAPSAPSLINGATTPAGAIQAADVDDILAQTGTPPWALSTCKACAGKGFNSKGSPCRICDSLQRKAHGPTSADYIVSSGDGLRVWEAKDGSGGGEAEQAPTPEPKASEKIELAPSVEPKSSKKIHIDQDLDLDELTKTEAPKEDPVEQVHEAIAEANASAASANMKKAAKSAERVLPSPEGKKKGGRQPRGYRIYIDCIPLGIKTVLAEQLFKILTPPDYYSLDVFKRREAWMASDDLEQQLGNIDIVVRNPNGSPDLKAFIEALKSVARPGNVIEGLS